MGIPELERVNMLPVFLLGTWAFIAIQFAKGRVWGDRWTAHISIGAPFLMAWVPVWGDAKMNGYAQAMAVIFLIATGFWSVYKASAAKE